MDLKGGCVTTVPFSPDPFSPLDDYPRKDKTSRGYPRKKQEHPAGAPRLCNATPMQVRLAREIKHTEKRLTA